MSTIDTVNMAAISSKFAQLGYRVIKPLSMSRTTIYLAEKGAKQYVLKPLGKLIFAQAKRTIELQDCHFVRAPIDLIERERTVVYEYMTNTLLHVVAHFSLSLRQRKRILYDILQGLEEMHSRHWVHMDLKPNNVMITYKAIGRECVIEKVMVGDVDNAVFLEPGCGIGCPVGNVWWRSPEAQLGVYVETPTDIFSFGLVCIFVMLERPILYMDKKVQDPAIPLSLQVLDRTIAYFGHLPSKLKRDVPDEVCQVLRAVENSFENGDKEFHLFKDWAENRLPNLSVEVNLEYLDDGFKTFVGKALDMDPDARASPARLLNDPWWSS